MTGLEDLHPDTPDVLALRRRVLLTGLLTAVLFFALAYVLTALDAASWTFPVLLVVLYLLVVRPLMRPVREATALRRRLARQAWLDHKEGRS